MDEQIVMLAHIQGLRKRGSGKHFVPRYKTAKDPDLRTVFRIERARYANLETGFRRTMQKDFAALADKKMTAAEMSKKFAEDLYRYQVKIYVAGRRTAGDLSNSLSLEERKYLHGQHSTEMRFFANFMRDVANGRGRMRYDQRMDLYALGGYSVYLRGALEGTDGAKAKRYFWDYNPEAMHCEQCIKNHNESRRVHGYTLHELLDVVGLPGEKTPCRNKCRCGIRASDGVRLHRTRPTGFAHTSALVNQ